MILPFVSGAWCGHTEASRTFAQDVVLAFEDAHLKREYAAREMGITPPMLARQLAGQEPLNLWRLASLPAEFHAAFLVRRARRVGGEFLSDRQLALIRGAAVLGRKTMARMVPAIADERQVS